MFDGVFSQLGDEKPVFHALKAPSDLEVDEVGNEVATKLAKRLRKLGLVSDDPDVEGALTPLDRWYAKVLRDRDVLVTLDEDGELEPAGHARKEPREVETHGFSVHAKVRVAALDRDARLRLCKYVLRPPLAHDQLSELEDGTIALQLKSPSKSGATHTLIEPLALVRRLAWLVPPVYRHQTIYAGVLSGSSKWGSEIVPHRPRPAQPKLSLSLAGASCAQPSLERALVPVATETNPRASEQAAEPTKRTSLAQGARGTTEQVQRGSVAQTEVAHDEVDVESLLAQDSYLCWADLLRRTYGADALQCDRCGGPLTPVGVITDPKVAAKILEHLGMDATVPRFRQSQGPP